MYRVTLGVTYGINLSLPADSTASYTMKIDVIKSKIQELNMAVARSDNSKSISLRFADTAIKVFRFQISQDSFFALPYISVPLGDTSYQPETDLPLGINYWRVGNDTNLYADLLVWSRISSVTVLDSAVPMLIPYTPDPTRDRRPTLVWHKSKNAASYRVQIDTIASFRLPIVIVPVTDTFYTPLADLFYGTIYWRVDANSAPDWFSTVDTFKIIRDTVGERFTGKSKNASGAPLIKYLHNSAAVTYALNKPARVSLCMYSITGTKISTLFDKYERAGLHTFIWNGNDNQGSRIPNGSYLVMLRIDSRSFAGRVTLVR